VPFPQLLVVILFRSVVSALEKKVRFVFELTSMYEHSSRVVQRSGLRVRPSVTNVVKVDVKIKLSLFVIKHRAMKTYWGSGSIAPCIVDLGTRWK